MKKRLASAGRFDASPTAAWGYSRLIGPHPCAVRAFLRLLVIPFRFIQPSIAMAAPLGGLVVTAVTCAVRRRSNYENSVLRWLHTQP
ncbi:hypothetical protein [Eleftheria terrae]|uniref:hypothetical protein n=1 Tax=Eleftheria terrae TaxID=1597781 RepID=UPI00263A8A5C|nr:hypothetical protein [Eleftheria terrae]WKB52912.1 hypothetical protein N7L95_00475 [Eleftheria terrae]